MISILQCVIVFELSIYFFQKLSVYFKLLVPLYEVTIFSEIAVLVKWCIALLLRYGYIHGTSWKVVIVHVFVQCIGGKCEENFDIISVNSLLVECMIYMSYR